MDVTKRSTACVAVLSAAAAATARIHEKHLRRRWHRRVQIRGTRYGCQTRIRVRRTVDEVFEILGPTYFKRAFRMSHDSFKKLATKLGPGISSACQKHATSGGSRFRHNGPITSDIRLGCAIRYFAGGAPVDIVGLFGLGHTDVLNSVWYVVDAVHQHPDFGIEYPESTFAQVEIAAQFRQKSGANFSCCAGAIDGMLIWIQRPSETECERLGVGSGKFFCARKHKFGLNCQAVCDCRGRILDISVVFPGTTSDCLAFEGSSLFQRLERGLLLPHLCFFWG
jgi:hypothetical protein